MYKKISTRRSTTKGNNQKEGEGESKNWILRCYSKNIKKTRMIYLVKLHEFLEAITEQHFLDASFSCEKIKLGFNNSSDLKIFCFSTSQIRHMCTHEHNLLFNKK